MDGQDLIWKNLYENMMNTDGREPCSKDSLFGEPETQKDDEDEEDKDPGEEWTAPADAPIDTEEKESLMKESMGLNIEELYIEVLYETLHMVGSEAETCDKAVILDYLRQAFKMEKDKHDTLLSSAQEREAPSIILNVEVIEAKDLRPKDPNGLSDPFCTLYLSSSSAHKYHTSVKPETLSPTWQEHFYLPVEDSSNDSLCLEVWDFDPAETIKEKVTKISGVKGVKGLSKLMKEIAVTASTGKHDNEIIGVAQIKLKSISSYGQTRWIELEKKSKSSVQGSLKLKMNFSSQKNHHVACQEYRHILRLLLLHELELNKKEGEEWNGEISSSGKTVLGQHSSQSGMSLYHEQLAKWIELSRLHANHRLCFSIFLALLESIASSIKEMKYSDDEIRMFWEASKKLLPSIFSYIKELKKINPRDPRNAQRTSSALNILKHLCSIENTATKDLFSKDLYGWIEDLSEESLSIKAVLEEAIRQTTLERFQQSIDSNRPDEITDEKTLKQAIKVTQTVRNDLQRAIEHYDTLFLSCVGTNYSKLIFLIYEGMVFDFVKPLVEQICSSMKLIRFDRNANQDKTLENDALSIGTALFELYLLLQKLSLLGSEIFLEEEQHFKLNGFHEWFHSGVAKWLDIAVYKAMIRIEKAIRLDSLVPVDSSVKYSSSALDTLSIFYQIKIFWTQLSWPDIEGKYTFAAKILDDLCRCCIYYTDNLTDKLRENFGKSIEDDNTFTITNEWCLAVNNIDYIKQSLLPFAKDLGIDDIIAKLADFKNQSTAETCDHTIKLVMENTVDILANKVIELLETVADKTEEPIIKKMLEVGNNVVEPHEDIDKLMQYLDHNLMLLHSHLNEINFHKSLSIIWTKVTAISRALTDKGLEERKPPYYFKNLEKTVDILENFFRDGDSTIKTDDIRCIKEQLGTFGLETTELIHRYYLERLEYQKTLTKADHGMLTVKVNFVGDNLKIDVLNARNLNPHDSNGFCDPYVKIILLPKSKFTHLGRFKTKTQKKTLFPLFEESFTLTLENDGWKTENALLHFTVKDQDFLYFDQFVGEAFVALSDVAPVDDSVNAVDQIHLILNKPTSDSKIMKVLDSRNGEKLAKDFIKKQKTKMNEKA